MESETSSAVKEVEEEELEVDIISKASGQETVSPPHGTAPGINEARKGELVLASSVTAFVHFDSQKWLKQMQLYINNNGYYFEQLKFFFYGELHTNF